MSDRKDCIRSIMNLKRVDYSIACGIYERMQGGDKKNFADRTQAERRTRRKNKRAKTKHYQ